MKTTQLIHISFTNIWRRKFRAVLTILGMAVGVGAMTLLISFASGLEKANREQILSSFELTQLTISKKQSELTGFGTSGMPSPAEEDKFTADDLAKLKNITHVKFAYIPVSMPSTRLIYNDHNVDVYFSAVPTALISDNKKQKIESGAWWDSDEAQAIVISATTAEGLKTSNQELVGKKVKIEILEFAPNGATNTSGSYEVTVAGIMKKSAESFGPFGLDSISQGLAEKISQEHPLPGDTQYTNLSAEVIVDDTVNVDSVRSEISKLGWHSSGVQEIIDSINKGFLIMKIVLGVIGGIGLVVALIGIINSMLMAVLERTREIGILMALGASRRTIAWIFLFEAAWLGFLGAAVGIAGGFLIGRLIMFGVNTYFAVAQKEAGEVTTFLKFNVSLMYIIGTLAAATLLTMLAGWLPARRAAKQNPVDSLRHE